MNNVSLGYPSFTSRSFCLLVVNAASVSAIKYTSIKPLGDRMLIKTETVEEKTASGIFIPTTVQTKSKAGEVVAIGARKKAGDKKVPLAVKMGSEVVYSKYVGTEVEVDGSTHLILKEDDITGVLETEDVKDLKPLNDRVLIKVIATGPGLLDEECNRKEARFCTPNMLEMT